MPRFTNRIQELRRLRIEKVEENRKKKAKRSGGASKAKKPKAFTFESKELELIFNSLPDDMQKMLKGR